MVGAVIPAVIASIIYARIKNRPRRNKEADTSSELKDHVSGEPLGTDDATVPTSSSAPMPTTPLPATPSLATPSPATPPPATPSPATPSLVAPSAEPTLPPAVASPQRRSITPPRRVHVHDDSDQIIWRGQWLKRARNRRRVLDRRPRSDRIGRVRWELLEEHDGMPDDVIVVSKDASGSDQYLGRQWMTYGDMMLSMYVNG